MPERHHGQASKFTDFPVRLYIIGLLLLFGGIAAQAYVAIAGNTWSVPPKWKSLKFIYWDFYPPDLQTELQKEWNPMVDDLTKEANDSVNYVTLWKSYAGVVHGKLEASGLIPRQMPAPDQNKVPSILGQGIPAFLPECLKKRGFEQGLAWATRVNVTTLDYLASQKRLAELERALNDPARPRLFLFAREKFKEEKLVYDTLKTKMKKLEISPAGHGFAEMLLVYLLVLSIFLTSSFLLFRFSRTHISPSIDLEDYSFSYWSFVLYFFLCLTGVVIYTSILKTEKYWIGASSFFVSPSAWCFERVAVLGLSMIMSIPATQLWCYLREKWIPQIPVSWLRAPDGKYTIEKYVLFLQTWTLVIFGSFAVITIGAIRWAASQQEQFESAYLLITVAGFGFAGCLILKMIRNAIELRRRYQESLSRGFDSSTQLRNENVPPDPTKDFIGESWWKLPLNFTGIVTAIWAVLEWSGVSTVILNALK